MFVLTTAGFFVYLCVLVNAFLICYLDFGRYYQRNRLPERLVSEINYDVSSGTNTN